MLMRRLILIAITTAVVLLAVALAVSFIVNESVAKAQTNSPAPGNSTTSGNSTQPPKNVNAGKSFDFFNATELVDSVETSQPGTVKPENVEKSEPSSDSTQPTETETIKTDNTSVVDPEKAEFTLHALAIGDWGVSPGGDSCCSKYKKVGEDHFRDQQAQSNVAYLLSLSAKALKPQAILSHGDNFYWNGLGAGDAKYRFENTFEAMYSHKSLDGIPWLNVLGNHDYGGSAYLCGNSDSTWRACTSMEEMLAAIEDRFNSQSTYRSPNGDRWKLPSRYYVETLEDPATGTTVDVFNVDTNAATVHGAEQVCCQCYGYQAGVPVTDPNYIKCNAVHRGHKMCFGGNTELFDACVAKFNEWTADSLKQLAKDTVKSKAEWKIVNSHYSPHYHMEPKMMQEWFDVLKQSGVQLFINGHTHAESHDVSTFNTHFITNGAGGGIQSESIGKPPPYVKDVEMLWAAANAPYGFFELSFSQQWLRTRFVTFDSKWKFTEDPKQTVKGSTAVQHCWYIPRDGSKGQECAKSE